MNKYNAWECLDVKNIQFTCSVRTALCNYCQWKKTRKFSFFKEFVYLVSLFINVKTV